jgi:NAD(P)-dependent dehydrogenase (short-subunit alcohol dehydrogenase family)
MGGEALGVPAHMGELDALPPIVEKTVERFGRLDIVVNNAANALRQDLGAFTEAA